MSRLTGRPTLAMVAKQAGVSVSTASLAFSGAGPITPDTKERVLKAAADLGYHGPNPLGRQLRSGRSGIVGVVMGDKPSRVFRDQVATQVLDGLMEVLGEHRLGVLLVPGIGTAEDQVDPLVESAAMDVAVMVWGAVPGDHHVEVLQQRGIPLVVGDGVALDGAALVGIEDRSGAAAAVRHLTELGHTRIAEIAMPMFATSRPGGFVSEDEVATATRYVSRERLAGFRDVCQPVVTWQTPGTLVEHGRDAALAILGPDSPAGERPTAIFAHSDLLAAGAVLATRELGLRLPEDVSIVGFDGLDLPWLSPDALTSVHQPLREKGVALGHATLEMLEDRAAEARRIPVSLVAGTTSGPAQRREPA
ncbi:MAG: LacI family DNA-binding transcriptional regulator [Promicromonosporaceae bacterium]|nr:LacI family DNA-binding transcriptional regulator [Promicromonosporaceae bacterium]